MITLNFDEFGRTHVSEKKFFEYVEQKKQRGDYYLDCTDWILYKNAGGCTLARYDRKGKFGEIF